MDELEAAIWKHFDAALTKASLLIRTRVAAQIEQDILASPEYGQLLTGRLKGELGVVNPEAVIREVIKNIQAGIVVEKIPRGLVVRLLKTDMSEALTAAGASFISEGSRDGRRKGSRVDWLEWWLTRGQETILTNFHFKPGPASTSRTGLGIMVEGGSWKVPSPGGTPANNFLTRALATTTAKIERIMYEEVQKHL